MPTASGSAAASSVQRRLPVSRRTVRSVVAQGMWKRNRQRNPMQFQISHPAADRVTPMAPAPGASVKLPPLCRIRSSTGTVSSFAGRESVSASRTAPLTQSHAPTGSSAAESVRSRFPSDVPIWLTSHSTAPAGAAAATARPSTNSVRSNRERTNTVGISGTRYGGISNRYADG